MGPERGELTWASPMRKFMERSVIWGTARAGLLNTIEAYRVFIVSVMLFCAQLDPLPSNCDDLEIKV